MEYHLLYVKCRKSFEVRKQNFFITLPCAKIKHLAKFSFAVCHKKATLPCALIWPCVFLNTLGKIYVCRVSVNLHTANFGAHGESEISGSA